MCSEIRRLPFTEDRRESERKVLPAIRGQNAFASVWRAANAHTTGWRVLKIMACSAFGWAALACSSAGAAESGDLAVVIYNSNLPDSKAVARHYADKRGVPGTQVFGFDLPASEAITRAEFRDKLQKPLLATLQKAKLFTFEAPTNGPGRDDRSWKLARAKIRYAVLCYGVPLKIQGDSTLSEAGSEKVRAEMRRNEAAVDSELALLPIFHSSPHLFGPYSNRAYMATNGGALHPTNGILMVARLDGPSASIARGLVDKALQVERDGLWGRAYFDSRGLTNGPYKIGDDWMRGSAEIARRVGFETVLDTNAETFSASFPMSHIALYAGWYDGNVSGPFARSKVEFMPGAIAYHLHSYSAASIRTPSAHWVGPLLDRGVTATMGCVEEPYLEGTPDLPVFFSRLMLLGFSFGEAAYAAQGSLSWQTTVVGDPLYRPFAHQPPQLHAELSARESKLIEWSILRAINQNMALGEAPAQYVEFLQKIAATTNSAVLLEKLGGLFSSVGQPEAAVKSYQRSLEQGPSPQQQIRLMLAIGAAFEGLGRTEEAYTTYQRFVKSFPEFPELGTIYKKLTSLADRLGKQLD
jgi:uncharacterized protein (TIGR03790 family)